MSGLRRRHFALGSTAPEHFAVSLGPRSIRILLTAEDGASIAVWTGKAGGTFVAGPALPTGHGFRSPLVITRQAGTGRLVVTGQAQVQGARGPLRIVTSKGSNGWSKPAAVDHTGSADGGLMLGIAPSTSTLHAAWSHRAKNSKASSVRHSLLGKKGWSKPTSFNGVSDQSVTQIEFTPAGTPVVVIVRVPLKH